MSNRLGKLFTLLDSDRDGIVSEKDLMRVFQTMGEKISEEDVSNLLKSAPIPLTRESFLAHLSSLLLRFDDKRTMQDALYTLSENKENKIKNEEIKDDKLNIDINYLKNTLIDEGMNEKDIDVALKGFIRHSGGKDVLNEKALLVLFKD